MKVSVTSPQRTYSIPGSIAVRLRMPSGDEDLLLTPIGDDLYRLEESTLLNDLELRWHDVIQAKEEVSGVLCFEKLVSLSGLKTVDSVASKVLQESDNFKKLLAKVVAMEGNWEVAFGGLVLLHVPASQETSISKELATLCSGSV